MQTIDSSSLSGALFEVAACDGITLQIAFVPNAGVLKVYSGPSGAGAITFTETTLSVPSVLNTLSIAFQTGSLFVYYTVSSSGNINYFTFINQGGGFGAALQFGSVNTSFDAASSPVENGVFIGGTAYFIISGSIFLGKILLFPISLTFMGMKVYS
jgi:hypothetical protein